MSKLENIITINDFNYSQGGASKVALDTANLLAKAGYNSVFISAVSDDAKSILNPEVKQYRFNGKEFLHYNNRLKGMLDGLRCKSFTDFVEKTLNDYNPNNTIVHVHGWTKACSSDFFRMLEKKGYKVFLTLHEYFSFCPNGAYYNYVENNACNKKACSLHCLSTNCDSRNYIFKLYRFIRELIYRKDIDLKSVTAIYISKFEKNIIEKQIKFLNCYVVENPVGGVQATREQLKYDFIYVGRTSKEKGIDLFLELAGALPESKFVIVGTYADKTPTNVIVTGWIPENEVDKYMAESKVLVFPSLWPETFGLNVVKALMMGIPCLVSSNTAAEEYVTATNGIVFQQGNADDLIEKAKMLSTRTYSGERYRVQESAYIEKLVQTYEAAR